MLHVVIFTVPNRSTEATPQRQLTDYLQAINLPTVNDTETELTLQAAATAKQYRHLHPLLQRVFCTPASSAPVERIFSQSGIIMRPHRAKMSYSLLETLVFLKCNFGC